MSVTNSSHCLHCRKPLDRRGSLCSSCVGKQKSRDTRKRARRMAEGRCTSCGKEHDHANGFYKCDPCCLKGKAYYHNRKNRREGTGRCPQCDRPLLPGRKRCATCTIRSGVCGRALKAKRRTLGQCVKCGVKLPGGYEFALCVDCRAQHRLDAEILKDKVFAAYGGYVCTCCGEVEKNFLQIDHIENNGAEHRKEIGTSLYKWLKKNGFPPGFQVLCANCNWGKRQCGGTCPHRLPKQPLD